MRAPDSINPSLLAAFGRRVRSRRLRIERSAAAFAEARGWDRNLWGRIERGAQNVSLSSLARVAAALEVPMAELLAGLEDEVARSGGAGGPAGDGERE